MRPPSSLVPYLRRTPRLLRRFPRPVLIGAAVAAIALAVIAVFLATRRAKEPEFKEHVVAKGNLAIIVSVSGEITPQNRIELKPPLDGRIESINVREGEFIKKGQVLAWLSSSERAALLDAARAKGPEEVARWEDAYKPTPLVAPLDGFIIVRRAEPGQSVDGSNPPLVMADRLIVRGQVDETDMAKVHLGQEAEISLDAYPEIRLPGRVDHLAFESRQVNNVIVYDLEVELLKSPSLLRAGMTATVGVKVSDRKGVLLVPPEALTETEGGLAVLVKRPRASPSLVPVTIGITDGAQVEVVKGISEGDILLISTKGVPPSSLSKAVNPLAPKHH